jgi:hypothetical protein
MHPPFLLWRIAIYGRKGKKAYNPKKREYDCSTSLASKISPKQNVRKQRHKAYSNNTHLSKKHRYFRALYKLTATILSCPKWQAVFCHAPAKPNNAAY